MATDLPVRIEFALPDGWRPAPPDEVDAPGAAFVALHPGSASGFTPNITIAGRYRPDETSLDAIADESVRRLEASAGATSVRSRTEVGSPQAPGLAQVLHIATTIQGAPGELVQCQVYVSMRDVDAPDRRAVIELVLTAAADQLDTVLGDFQWFVRTVRPAETATHPTAEAPARSFPRHTYAAAPGGSS